MIWNNILDKKPLAYKTGPWDGKKSDKILVCTRSGNYYVVEMYEGIIDGYKFCEFYDNTDSVIYNIAFWTEIDNPL